MHSTLGCLYSRCRVVGVLAPRFNVSAPATTIGMTCFRPLLSPSTLSPSRPHPCSSLKSHLSSTARPIKPKNAAWKEKSCLYPPLSGWVNLCDCRRVTLIDCQERATYLLEWLRRPGRVRYWLNEF